MPLNRFLKCTVPRVPCKRKADPCKFCEIKNLSRRLLTGSKCLTYSFPLLLGKFESELPEARKGFAGSQPLDRWSHIFKDFKAQGYATLFSEDAPVYAAFNYRLHGFKDPPTDHFSRYFWEAAHMTSPQCVHSKPQHQIHFDYITSFLEAYRNQPKFGLFFMSEISHNNLENVYFCADNFVALLRHLYGGNLLNDSLLIVMSDTVLGLVTQE